MAEVMIMSLLEAVGKCVAPLATNEVMLLWNSGKELKKLEETLEAIRAVLADAEERRVKDRAAKGWLERLKDVAYDADDLLDGIATDMEELKRARDMEFDNPCDAIVIFFRKSIPLWWNITHGVKGIRERMDAIADDRNKYQLKEAAAAAGDWKDDGHWRETASHVKLA